MDCIQCGLPLERGMRFCPRCGNAALSRIQIADQVQAPRPDAGSRPISIWLLSAYLGPINAIRYALSMLSSYGYYNLLQASNPDLAQDMESVMNSEQVVVILLLLVSLVAATQLWTKGRHARSVAITYFVFAPASNLIIPALGVALLDLHGEAAERMFGAGIIWFIASGLLSLIAIIYLLYSRRLRDHLISGGIAPLGRPTPPWP